MSDPDPPSTVSKPLPPLRISSPDPPFRRSLPAPPDRMSSPLPPTRLSLLLVPTVVAIFHPPGRRAPRLLVGRRRRLTTPCRMDRRPVLRGEDQNVPCNQAQPDGPARERPAQKAIHRQVVARW
ncbi:MAG: hypothetical protein EOR88_20060 [Mesorhizobium sp.]|nr:hypothetical protein EOA49_21575 [Mesorhizobium sp. M1A.F.Ca.IN.020.04.1.1]RUW05864.1 hypothetical protein EOA53_24880 [Mesorhizobium sp. M1A.F.Ca.IN.020.03.1.1]RWF69192.1 MAG: hypothetical protein EOQ34_22890 [Mesorhizobium sp.]RWG14247.1 MAG: hypothetical protein EOQ58_15205 [Mesorhizobium sp.]RWG31228.1 MAG: hypothetical protein EOQ61_13625 [Mesorhizobium sp.]